MWLHSFETGTKINKAWAPLTTDQIKRQAPSVFAVEPWQAMSRKYQFIPTISVIEGMQKEGFQVVSATQSRCRTEGKSDFTKHAIRFRRIDSELMVGDTFPEVMLVNSHDGSSSYKLFSALYRLVCSNQAIASMGSLSEYRTSHTGNIMGEVIEASYRIIGETPKIADAIQTWRGKTITDEQAVKYANAAALLRWDAEQDRPTAGEMLTVRRSGDREDRSNLWGAFNRMQEALLKGGDRYVATDPTTRRQTYKRTRKINGIDQDTKLNRALWTLTESMAAMV